MNRTKFALIRGKVKLLLWFSACLLILLTGVTFSGEDSKEDRFSGYAPQLSKVDLRTQKLLESLPVDSTVAVWIFFEDKGLKTSAQLKTALEGSADRLSERSMERRMRRGRAPWVDFTDIPVNPGYLHQLENLGVRVRVVSKWLNAASVLADRQQIEEMVRLSSVQKVQPVARFNRSEPQVEEVQPRRVGKAPKETAVGYGQSYAQLAQIHVPDFHRIDITGEGVLITFFDTGFFIHHPSFEHILNSGRLEATWDFINDDEDVEDEDDIQRSHGTSVWSLVGGFVEDTLVGAAYGAQFALAKTELEGEEIQAEEDHWVAAIEWAEALGTDIVSTSLGYNLWYSYEDMDGNTALCTRAADLAVSKGVVVVNAAGNERDDPWYYIIAPADGDSVIAAGAVDLNGSVARFSSAGPTYDGRIKPDVMALGVADYCATRDGGYGHNQGTSFATPLVAGACALLLEANPDWNPIQVREALWTTASLADNPNNLMGYGIVNAAKASGFSYLETSPQSFEFEASLGDTHSQRTTLEMVDWQGESLEWSASANVDWITLFPESGFTPDLIWVTVNPSGLQAGINEAFVEIAAGSAINSLVRLPLVLTLHSTTEALAFPNPFTDSLTVLVKESGAPRRIKIDVFTVSGERVHRFPEYYGPETYQRSWHGRNEEGEEVGNGIYLLKADIAGQSQIIKVAKVK